LQEHRYVNAGTVKTWPAHASMLQLTTLTTTTATTTTATTTTNVVFIAATNALTV